MQSRRQRRRSGMQRGRGRCRVEHDGSEADPVSQDLDFWILNRQIRATLLIERMAGLGLHYHSYRPGWFVGYLRRGPRKLFPRLPG